MNKAPKAPRIPWWASVGRTEAETPAPAPDTDYADMGTAFGLDASLSPRNPAPPAAEDADPATDRLNRRSVI